MEEKHEDTISSLFGQVEFQVHPMVNLLAAARFDHFSVLESDDSEISPKAAIVFSPNTNHSLRFTFNRAFQTPNYSEMFLQVAAGPIVPLNQVELGLEAAISAQIGQPICLGEPPAHVRRFWDEIAEPGYRRMIETTTRLNTPGPELAALEGVHALTDVTGFGLAGHALERKADPDLAAVAATVAGREIAIDAALDPVAFRPNVDGFGDVQRGVAPYLDFADEARDALFS